MDEAPRQLQRRRPHQEWLSRALTGWQHVMHEEPASNFISESELLRHSVPEDAWVAVNGRVYDVTPYLEFHPGGAKQLMRGAGRDATELFRSFHSWVNVELILRPCWVGMLSYGDTAGSLGEAVGLFEGGEEVPSVDAPPTKPECILERGSGAGRVAVQLLSQQWVGPSTVRLRLELPHGSCLCSSLALGEAVLLDPSYDDATAGRKAPSQAVTAVPLSHPWTPGYFDVLVEALASVSSESAPTAGQRQSGLLLALSPGSCVWLSGPVSLVTPVSPAPPHTASEFGGFEYSRLAGSREGPGGSPPAAAAAAVRAALGTAPPPAHSPLVPLAVWPSPGGSSSSRWRAVPSRHVSLLVQGGDPAAAAALPLLWLAAQEWDAVAGCAAALAAAAPGTAAGKEALDALRAIFLLSEGGSFGTPPLSSGPSEAADGVLAARDALACRPALPGLPAATMASVLDSTQGRPAAAAAVRAPPAALRDLLLRIPRPLTASVVWFVVREAMGAPGSSEVLRAAAALAEHRYWSGELEGGGAGSSEGAAAAPAAMRLPRPGGCGITVTVVDCGGSAAGGAESPETAPWPLPPNVRRFALAELLPQGRAPAAAAAAAAAAPTLLGPGDLGSVFRVLQRLGALAAPAEDTVLAWLASPTTGIDTGASGMVFSSAAADAAARGCYYLAANLLPLAWPTGP